MREEYISCRNDDYKTLWYAFKDQKGHIDINEFVTSFNLWTMRRQMEDKPIDVPWVLFLIRKYYDIKFGYSEWQIKI